MVYEIQLVEEKVKQQQVTALHLICSLAFIGTGAIIVAYNYVIEYWGLALLLCGIALLVATMAKNKWVTTPRNNTIIRIVELLIAITVAIYSVSQEWKLPMGIFTVLGAAVAFAIFWEGKLNTPKVVEIDEQGIRLPSTSRKRFIEWVAIEQVLLRFGTLSIDCADNTLFQWNVRESGISQETFESFCATQIEAGRGKRKNDDW